VVTLFNARSGYQQIALEGDQGRLCLSLDGYFQFDSKTERHYHGFLVTLPGLIAGDLGRVLIMGGGDGLALRDALALGAREAWLVELDKDVLDLARRRPISDLNQGSLSDPRAKVIVADAKVAVDQFPDGFFDLIIADFPAATTSELETLYEPAFYEKVFAKLSASGVFASQISEEPEFLREVRLFMERSLGHGFALIAMPTRTETQAFVYGSRRPLRVRRQAPVDSVIAGLVPRLEAALRDGKRVLSYNAPMRPVRFE
jgi:spermidine synthase